MRTISVSHHLSVYPVLIRIIAETGMDLGSATAFFYEYEDIFYLITNGHNVTGVNPETNTRTSTNAALVTELTMSVRYYVPEEQLAENGLEPRGKVWLVHPDKTIIDLYEDEDHTVPRWYVHPKHGHQVDVIAIPLYHKSKIPAHILMLALNSYKGFQAEPHVADDVFILGYPFGITDSLQLPIWKRASIASEPAVAYKDLPRMLVDTASRPGMSGSPVILRKSGFDNITAEGFTDDTILGTVEGFVGVYSGRIGTDKEDEAQLGIVWRKEVIEEILSAKQKATNSFQHIS